LGYGTLLTLVINVLCTVVKYVFVNTAVVKVFVSVVSTVDVAVAVAVDVTVLVAVEMNPFVM
jgi:hypothetical protein